MKLSQFFTGGAMAALAAALAFTAMPAQAQDNDRRGWRTSQSEARSERRAERSARQTQRAERRAARPAAQPQRATPQRTERRPQVAQQRSTRDWNRQPSAVRRKVSAYSPIVAGSAIGRAPPGSGSARLL